MALVVLLPQLYVGLSGGKLWCNYLGLLPFGLFFLKRVNVRYWQPKHGIYTACINRLSPPDCPQATHQNNTMLQLRVTELTHFGETPFRI